uniref:Suppressor of white apricot N-terminal domain-containing protein n=2 Tax=Meloidogyne TaxID=189290 RepID=A0A915MC76_MELJA
MWHEARRQERAVRHKLVDGAKRHERRRQFYESVRRDPNEFMQVHGQHMPIHVDPVIAEAAESPNILRKWQGDDNILIDRFDVRVHLEQIQDPPSKQAKRNLLKDDVMELQFSESNFLAQIAAKEFWPSKSSSPSSTYKKEREKKKNSDKRAAIAFSYGNSEVVRISNTSKDWKERRINDATMSSSDDDEPEEMDPVVDTSLLNAESLAFLNKIGTKYNITSGAFLQLLGLDQKEQTSTAEIKEIDKAKSALSGRHAKADRAVLKRRRAMIIGNLGSTVVSNEEATTTLLSFLSSANKNSLKEETSSSDSGEDFERTEFITCFGEDDEKNAGKKNMMCGPDENDGEKGVVHGPVLPTKEYRRLLELSRRKSISPDSQWNRHQSDSKRGRRYSRSSSPHSPRKKRRSHSRSSSSSSRYLKRSNSRRYASSSSHREHRDSNRTRTSYRKRRSSSHRRKSCSSSSSPSSKSNPNNKNSSSHKRIN